MIIVHYVLATILLVKTTYFYQQCLSSSQMQETRAKLQTFVNEVQSESVPKCIFFVLGFATFYSMITHGTEYIRFYLMNQIQLSFIYNVVLMSSISLVLFQKLQFSLQNLLYFLYHCISNCIFLSLAYKYNSLTFNIITAISTHFWCNVIMFIQTYESS